MKKLILIVFLFANAAFAQQMIKSGSVYKTHPYIEVIKKLALLYEKGDANGMATYYDAAASFHGMGRYNTGGKSQNKSLTEAKAGWTDIIKGWGNIKMEPTMPPVALQYTGTVITVQSWWKLTLTNKKTKKAATVEMVLFDTFNNDGKIASQLQYYDPTPLLAAMK